MLLEIMFLVSKDTSMLCSLDVDGLYGGLITRWNDNIDVLSTHFLYTSIVLEGLSKRLEKSFKLLNPHLYFGNCKPFYDLFKALDCFVGDNVIIGVDLSLKLNSREICNELARIDPLDSYFLHLFEDCTLIDIKYT